MSHKVIYRKLKKNFERKGYININHVQVESKEKIAEIGEIFRNPRYETFRIIYMKDKSIVGHEIISSKLISNKEIFTYDKTGRTKTEMNLYKIQNRMTKLNANGYYMVHNRLSYSNVVLKEDINLSKYFSEKINGFKGHLIINYNSYLEILIKNNYVKVINKKEIKGNIKKFKNKLERNGIEGIYIKNSNDIANLMNNIINTVNYSTLLILKLGDVPEEILDVPNEFLNSKNEKNNKYIKLLNKSNFGLGIYLATNDEKTFNKSTKLIKEEIFKDSVLYKEKDKKLYIY